MSSIVNSIQGTIRNYKSAKIEKQIAEKEGLKTKLEKVIQSANEAITTVEVYRNCLTGRMETLQLQDMDGCAEDDWVVVVPEGTKEKITQLSEEIDTLRAKLVAIQS